jgi:hypothetical protein
MMKMEISHSVVCKPPGVYRTGEELVKRVFITVVMAQMKPEVLS